MDSRDDERISTNRGERLRAVAASIVRDWAWQDVVAIAADVEAVGRSAVEGSAREIARLPAGDDSGGSEGLAMLGVMIEEIEHPPRRRWSVLPGRSTRGTMPISRLSAIIEQERDVAMLRAVALKRDRLRLEAGDDAFEEALVLIGLLEVGAVAVAREVAVDDPRRAAMLRSEVGALLSARRRDLGMQLLVLRQALATHDIVAKGHTALVEALHRARDVTIGAARTAVAARRAVADAVADSESPRRGLVSNDLATRLNAAVDRWKDR